MKVELYNTAFELGKASAKKAAQLIRNAIEANGAANIILATGTSQFETLDQLVKENIDWSKVTMFHLDEYIGLPYTHPASFRKYLSERFIRKVFLKVAYLANGEINPREQFAHFIVGEADPEQECKRLGNIIKQHPIDVALIGIGENGHLAFNDPPADFETKEPYIIVELDEACRKQQLNEGWFNSLDDVPRKAISMSVHQIMLSKNIICSVPDKRKATAVKNCLESEVNNFYPASILQQHKNCIVYLDKDSASLLSNQIISSDAS